MSRNFNRNSQKSLRQFLRNNATRAERVLWSRLKGKQLNGYKFRRQEGIKNYVVDFYCPACMLAVEIDGETHWSDEEIERDRKRQKDIEDLGVLFLRFTNRDVYENLEGVLQMIAEKCDAIKSSAATTP
jgi:very-short-patch-repair endonuclease